MKPANTKRPAPRFDTIQKASFLYEAAIHPIRRQILGLLMLETGLPLIAIADALFLEEEICLQQLSILCGVGLVIRRRDTGTVNYLLDREKLDLLYASAENLLDG